jgi:predicted nucleic acid-binding protein
VILYVESNFVLELALLQEEHAACERIVTLAESDALTLMLPAFCIGEPYEKLIRQRKRRSDLHRKLALEIRELGRSRAYAAVVDSIEEVSAVLLVSSKEEQARLDAVLHRQLGMAIVIPLDQEVLAYSLTIQKPLRLGPQDAIVYASVVTHASRSGHDKIFLNRNSQDFLVPDIRESLERLGCKLLTSFVDGLRLLERPQRRNLV